MEEPMFFGNPVNVARYDQQRHPFFEKLTEKQLSFFWRPEEVDVSRDRVDFQSLTEAEKHIFTSNLQYQILLDSVQGRAPSIAFSSITSIPELETWITTWDFSETIHSRSYTHIIRNVYNMPESVFNQIMNNDEIEKRATDVSKYYDDLIFHKNLYDCFGEGTVTAPDGRKVTITMRSLKKKLYLCMQSVNALEAIRFYVSFACTFAFVEREKIDGIGKIMRLIARDESLHLSGTQHIINLFQSGQDDPEMAIIAKECEGEARAIFLDAVEQEKAWAEYLFSQGSMLGLNAKILTNYIEFIANQRMSAIGFGSPFEVKSDPLPWMKSYLVSDNVQVAPQEAELQSYLVGQIDATVSHDDFADFAL
jgi:ribonucleoside-diphosphate reductase beta chain